MRMCFRVSLLDSGLLVDDVMMLMVNVSDSGVPPLHSEASVRVRVDDINHDAPHFEQALYEAVVTEHSVEGSVVLTVNAHTSQSYTQLSYTVIGTHHFVIQDANNVSKGHLGVFWSRVLES